MARALFSLQSKLIVAFVLVMLLALMLAASIFVFVRRGELEEQKLDHVIAASPVVFAEFSILRERGAQRDVMGEFVDVAADAFDVRILLVDRGDGAVIADSGGELTGEALSVPDEVLVSARRAPPARLRPYFSWEPADGTPGSDLILVSTVQSDEFGRFGLGRGEGPLLVLAVPEATIADAWQGLVRGLLVAAAIALAVAVGLAVLLARYITRPLQQLTVASQRMAEGSFDVDVSVDRSDEVGRLAQAFSGMARRVGEAHSQMRALVANVSHDLKTPLTSILGFAQALRDGGAAGDAESRRMGGVIYDEASRLSSRLNDLLYLSELESGQALLQRDEIDLGRLLEQAVRRVEAGLAARGVQLQLDAPEGIIVSADGPKLERVVENLLDNARKYTPPGGEVRVRCRAEGGRARIEVANSAPDVSENELPRFFERFYRRDRGRGGAVQGSGLGLPIARDLVELHGGTLDAVLADGALVFTVELPTT